MELDSYSYSIAGDSRTALIEDPFSISKVGGLLKISNIAGLSPTPAGEEEGKKEDLGVSGTNATEVAVFAFRVVVAIESS